MTTPVQQRPLGRGHYGKNGRFQNVRTGPRPLNIVHRASRHKVYDGTTTSVRHSQLGWLHAASPTFFWRSALHKDGSGRARSGSSEVVHSSSVSIRTDIPDAHVTRWPSGRARSRPPSAPLIGKDGQPKGRVSLPFATALPDRPRIFTGARAIVSCVRPSKRGVHPTTTARTRGTPDLVRVAEKIALSQLGSDFP